MSRQSIKIIAGIPVIAIPDAYYGTTYVGMIRSEYSPNNPKINLYVIHSNDEEIKAGNLYTSVTENPMKIKAKLNPGELWINDNLIDFGGSVLTKRIINLLGVTKRNVNENGKEIRCVAFDKKKINKIPTDFKKLEIVVSYFQNKEFSRKGDLIELA